jgi:hypothetical protein
MKSIGTSLVREGQQDIKRVAGTSEGKTKHARIAGDKDVFREYL